MLLLGGPSRTTQEATSIHSDPSIRSIVVLHPTLLLRLVGTQKTSTWVETLPWYLTTAAVAEQLYDALIVWQAQGSLSITTTSLAFFQQFMPTANTGTFASTTTTYATLTSAVKSFADGFINVIARYTPSGGGLSEQYSKSNGSPVSASDLTWSYASVLSAFSARAGTRPASWGASGLTVPPSCQTSPGTQPAWVAVTFNVVATTFFGENIYITGNTDGLQNWETDTAALLSSVNYPTWSITINVPASTDIQYKYIRKVNGVFESWESDPNNEFMSPKSGTLVRNDQWR
ncbi:Glucoamylase [Mycena indigotica]|uniref:glucan 1,4-alpha-glucosidase n=1 Tax=Mycena indigotica TaxID=2126181 RepID=A0A8H6SHA8_9AGAR|nr:Glucoamylase [Mycena indigotica]KAF7298785.1 Glucoamylase [Mycena indigotica]